MVATMANWWARREDREATVITLRRGDENEYPISLGVCVVRGDLIDERNPVWNPGNIFRLFRLRRVLRRLQPDAVVSFADKLNAAVIISLWGVSIPVVATEHLAPWKNSLGVVWEALRRFTYPRARIVISPTEAITRWFGTHYSGRYVTLPYPFSLLESTSEVERRKVILAVGRLTEQKGFAILIEGFSRIALRFPEWNLEIAGEGPLQAQLQEQISRSNLATRVHLLGRIQEMASVYNSSEVFVLSSLYEAFPMVLGEAMSAGCCVVATDCPTGPREILGSEMAECLVGPGDPQAIANRLAEYLSSPQLREQMRTMGRKRCRAFGAEELMPVWDAALTGWLDHPS